jgi:peptidyl-prolyl cis-trans isomerase SurA
MGMTSKSSSFWAYYGVGTALCLLAFAGGIKGPPPAAAEVQRIAAIVNDEVISAYDLNQRLKLVISSAGLQATDEVLRRIEPQVLRSLVEEHLELQEATKQKIKVDEKEVEQALGTVARQNNMSAAQIQTFLAKGDIDVSTLKDQIRANLAWTRLINERFGGRVYISDEDVKAELDRLKQSIAQTHYEVAEIVLRVDSPDQDEDVHKTAERLLEQLHQGAPFQSVAQQFSQSSTAATGGNMGWVQRGQLAAEVGQAIDGMSPGQVSGAIRTAGAYHIILLRNKREAGKMQPVVMASAEGPAATETVKRVQIAQILVPLAPKASDAQVQAATALANETREKLEGCSNAAAVAAGQKKLQFTALPMMPFAQIAPFFQQAIMATPEGKTSTPMRSPMGLHLIIVCKKEVEEARAPVRPVRQASAEAEPSMPNPQEIQGRLYNQQLSMMSRRYLRDLRRDAVVEYR